MTSKTWQQRRQLVVQGGRATREPRADVLSHLKNWIVLLACVVGLLTQLGVPDLVKMHTIIQSGWTGTIKIIEPTGRVLEMDNRQGLQTKPEGQQSKETTAEKS